jgi:hypothetical protein
MNNYSIYPKQFQYEKILTKKNTCFMIMPFDDSFNAIYGVIKEEAEKNGILCSRADEMNGSQPVVNKIITGILESQYIIVDITHAKPNVFYELGIAHSFRDAQSILLIKQQGDEYPFDISHLPYQNYSAKNVYQLKSIINDFIKSSKCITDFRDALAINDIYDNTITGSMNYIEYIEDYFGENICIYSYILNTSASKYEKPEIDNAFANFENFLKNTILEHNLSMMDGVIRVYIKLIEKCDLDDVSRKYTKRFSDTLLVAGIEDRTMIITKETDLMLALAESNKLLDQCLPWIIGYFSKSKSSNIDLNRYKLESFLMNSSSKEVESAIINSMYHEDCHIREHMADIIGAKGIINAYKTLKSQLFVEENWFTIGSIIEAIGKIAPKKEGLQIIDKWIDINGTMLIEQKQFFLLKHIFHALSLLEIDSNEYTDKFITNYGKYFHQNQVGPL